MEASTALIVIGCGKWGTNIINKVHDTQNLVAIVDSEEPNLKAFQQNHDHLSHIPMYTDTMKALNEHLHASVIVATPPSSHYMAASLAIGCGRHVLVEKPLCANLDDARVLVERARSINRILMVDHLLQYSTSHRRLIHLVSSGFVGDLTRIRMSRLNFGTVRTAENVLWSLSPHDLSILLAIVKGVSNGGADIVDMTVICHGQCVISQGIEDYVNVLVTFHRKQGADINAHIEASWMHPFKERRTIVYGTEGTVILNEATQDSNTPQLQAFKWRATPHLDCPPGKVTIIKQASDMRDHLSRHDESQALSYTSSQDPLGSVISHFVHCIRDQVTPRTDGQEALSVMSLLSVATDSLRQNGAAVTATFGEEESADGDLPPSVMDAVEASLKRATERDVNTTGAVMGPSTNQQANGAVTRVDLRKCIHETAVVDNGAEIGDGTKVWHFCHIMSGAQLGSNCNIGQNVYIGGKVRIGKNVKIQNNVSVYDGVTVEDDVFLGPSCVFTNVRTPRAHINRRGEYSHTSVAHGATVGANVTIVCGVKLGEFCFVGAGAVVTNNVPPHALVYGNPAKVHGWVSTCGVRLQCTMKNLDAHRVQLTCPQSGEVYTLYEKGNGVSGSSDTFIVKAVNEKAA